MWESIESLSKINHYVQFGIVVGGLLLAFSAGISLVLSSRISVLEKILDNENNEKILQLEQKLKQETKKRLPVKNSNGKTNHLPLEVPPDEE